MQVLLKTEVGGGWRQGPGGHMAVDCSPSLGTEQVEILTLHRQGKAEKPAQGTAWFSFTHLR